ncbi:MAG: 50S ribosomal protein L23 [Patescibacteria group bacterium]
MSLLDRFKKKKVPMQKPSRILDTEGVGKVLIPKKKLSKVDIKKTVSAYNIIKEPCVTEKASFLTEQNKYVFKVALKTNKIEIKKAIELIYNTKVKNVRVIHASPKKRRLGRREGWRGGLKHGFKKAIVTLKKGEKIELLPR